MATIAILAELQRRAGAASARSRSKGGMRGYMVLGADPWGLGASFPPPTLAALSPTDATNQIFPTAKIKSSAGHNQAVWDQMLASVNAGQLVNAQGGSDYVPGTSQCAAASGNPNANLQLAQTASGLALTGASIGLVAAGTVTAAALAPFTMGISAIIGLFPILFGHHAQAVKKEQSVLCAAVPAANNYLAIIDQAVQTGKATPQQAISALQSLVSDFQSQVSSIMHGSDPTSSGECNAACVELSKLRAIVALKQSVYQDLAAAGGAGSTAGGSGPTTAPVVSSGSTMLIPAAAAPASSPNWLGIAALLVGGFLLVRAI